MSEAENKTAMENRAAKVTYRANECAVNVPVFEVKQETVAEKSADAVASKIEEAEKNGEAAEAIAVNRQNHGGAIAMMRSIYLPLVIGAAALLGLFLFMQFVEMLAMVQTLPTWQNYLVMGVVIIFGCVAIIAGGGFAIAWLRLRKFSQIKLPENFSLTKKDVAARQSAKKQIAGYLRNYPDTVAALQNVGLQKADAEQVLKKRRYLLEEEFSDTGAWLDFFRDQFQHLLDEHLRNEIGKFAKQAAIGTAASPFALLDALVVIACALRMLGAICRVYNLRANRITLGMLLIRMVFTTLIGNFAQAGFDEIADLGSEQTAAIFGNSIGKIIGSATPKIAEGAINYYFMRRLGRTTLRTLQPIRAE